MTSLIAQHQGTGRRAVLAVVVVAVLSTTAAPAFALADPPSEVAQGAPAGLSPDRGSSAVRLAYSADGVGFSQTVPAIFENTPKLVPGESVEEKLWVRNDYDVAVDVVVGAPVLTAGGPGAAEQHVSVPVGQAPVEVEPSTIVTLDPGASGTVLVRLTLPETAGNTSQGQAWPVNLQVNISEAASTPEAATQHVELGHTGGMTGIWPLSVAAILAGVGAYAGARRRNRHPVTAIYEGTGSFESSGS